MNDIKEAKPLAKWAFCSGVFQVKFNVVAAFGKSAIIHRSNQMGAAIIF
ncbi:MAG: hypothetical protein ACPGLV_18245 [Bacteroidia bacterium]